MQRTKIEWVKNPDGSPGFTWNPIKGLCPMGCSYCYARKMYKRFGWDKTIRLSFNECDAPRHRKRPSTIFAGSTFELFSDEISSSSIAFILKKVQAIQWHTYLFLSKNPRRYSEFIGWPPSFPIRNTCVFPQGNVIQGPVITFYIVIESISTKAKKQESFLLRADKKTLY